jgi:hypothetical protein
LDVQQEFLVGGCLSHYLIRQGSAEQTTSASYVLRGKALTSKLEPLAA